MIIQRQVMRSTLLILTVALFALTASPAHADVALLRPNEDIKAGWWSAVGAPSRWDSLNDSVTESQTPKEADYVTVSSSSSFSVGLTNVDLNGASMTSGRAWFYTSNAVAIKLTVRTTSGALASSTFSTSGWHSVTLPASLSEAQLNELALEGTTTTNVSPKLLAAFFQMDVAVPQTGRHFHIGISANSRSALSPGHAPGEIQDEVVDTGASYIREDLDWKLIQPSPGEWIWSGTDQLFQEAAERSLTILPVLHSPPCWAVPSGVPSAACENTFPVNKADFAAFTGQVVKRYGTGGSFWQSHPGLSSSFAPRFFEILNEPYFMNSPYSEGPEQRYPDLYIAAVAAGRDANPGSRFLIGAVPYFSGPNGVTNWVTNIFGNHTNLGGYVDGIAVHPYPQNRDPFYARQGQIDASLQNAEFVYEAFKAKGVNKPVWMTEVGYTACEGEGDRCAPGATQTAREERKAQWITALFNQAQSRAYGFLHGLFLYNLREWVPQSEPSEDSEEWYGILGSQHEQLPGWSAFATAVDSYDGVSEPSSTILSRVLSLGKITFSFSADDPTSLFECQLDSAPWAACSSPTTVPNKTWGHTFQVRAKTDEVTESTPSVYTW